MIPAFSEVLFHQPESVDSNAMTYLTTPEVGGKYAFHYWPIDLQHGNTCDLTSLVTTIGLPINDLHTLFDWYLTQFKRWLFEVDGITFSRLYEMVEAGELPDVARKAAYARFKNMIAETNGDIFTRERAYERGIDKASQLADIVSYTAKVESSWTVLTELGIFDDDTFEDVDARDTWTILNGMIYMPAVPPVEWAHCLSVRHGWVCDAMKSTIPPWRIPKEEDPYMQVLPPREVWKHYPTPAFHLKVMNEQAHWSDQTINDVYPIVSGIRIKDMTLFDRLRQSRLPWVNAEAPYHIRNISEVARLFPKYRAGYGAHDAYRICRRSSTRNSPYQVADKEIEPTRQPWTYRRRNREDDPNIRVISGKTQRRVIRKGLWGDIETWEDV